MKLESSHRYFSASRSPCNTSAEKTISERIAISDSSERIVTAVFFVFTAELYMALSLIITPELSHIPRCSTPWALQLSRGTSSRSSAMWSSHLVLYLVFDAMGVAYFLKVLGGVVITSRSLHGARRCRHFCISLHFIKVGVTKNLRGRPPPLGA